MLLDLRMFQDILCTHISPTKQKTGNLHDHLLRYCAANYASKTCTTMAPFGESNRINQLWGVRPWKLRDRPCEWTLSPIVATVILVFLWLLYTPSLATSPSHQSDLQVQTPNHISNLTNPDRPTPPRHPRFDSTPRIHSHGLESHFVQFLVVLSPPAPLRLAWLPSKP
jgi:hypothetical protein